jgi:hypothetical protein
MTGSGAGSVRIPVLTDPDPRRPKTFAQRKEMVYSSVFSIPDPGSRVEKIPDPGSGYESKNLSIFNPKNLYKVLKNIIRDILSGSWIWILFHPVPGSRDHKAPDPGSGSAGLSVPGLTSRHPGLPAS